jgi:EpsI family protein
MSRVLSVVLATLMVLVGSLAWSLQFRDPMVVEAASLEAIPREIEGWRASDIPLESVVESMLRADYNVQRRYENALGDVVWLYLGYYGTDRGGVPEHTPPVCYAAQGWTTSARGELVVGPERGLRVNEMVVELRGRRHLVHYWYRSHDRVSFLTTFGLRLGQVWSRLASGRADGSLVRLSTRIASEEDVPDARLRLAALAQALDAALDERWPRERRAQ